MKLRARRRLANRKRKAGLSTEAGVIAALLAIGSPGFCAIAAASPSVKELSALSLEELGNIPVTSVFKRPEPLSQAPAAIYVITNDAIRRSGATSLPEALRLAPNLNVVRVNSSSYAISARGFNTFEAAIKLLVLIDGRSVYTPLHAGVFWDQQQVMVEDIDRIEVISGPGGTLYGANAFNGVINVITKHSRDTQGGLVSTQIGNIDRTGAIRYGGKIGEHTTYRGYGRGAYMGDTRLPDGTEDEDDWEPRQVGFRSDWERDRDAITVQGDFFRNTLAASTQVEGGNILGRWSRRLSETSGFKLQGYFDKTERLATGVTDRLQTVDIGGQYNFRLGSANDIVLGGGFRHSVEEFTNTVNIFVLRPEKDTQQLANIFVQDSIALGEDVTLTLGNKFEHNSHTGLELMPNARLAWRATDNTLLWSAVSRAVRTPSRFDRDLQATGILDPADDFKSETVIAYEAGIRMQPTDVTSLSVSVFYNDYDDLRVLGTAPSGHLFFSNRMHGTTYGVETWGDYKVYDWWRLSAGFTYLNKGLKLEPGASATALDQHQGNDPDYQASLRSSMDVTRDVEWDIGIRFVDNLTSPVVPGYAALDTRIGWDVTPSVEVSLAGFNLLDDGDGHGETRVATGSRDSVRRDIPRTVYAGLRVRF